MTTAPTTADDIPNPHDRALIRAEDLVAAHEAGNATPTEGDVGKKVRRRLIEAAAFPEQTKAKALESIAYIDDVPGEDQTGQLLDLRDALATLESSPELAENE